MYEGDFAVIPSAFWTDYECCVLGEVWERGFDVIEFAQYECIGVLFEHSFEIGEDFECGEVGAEGDFARFPGNDLETLKFFFKL